jgi:prevent-host-death family protein
MERASISELKASLSEYISHVRAGEEVVITDRGRAVARIIPLRKDDSSIDARMKQLEAAGLARVGEKGLPIGFWDEPMPCVPVEAVKAAMLDEREDGR